MIANNFLLTRQHEAEDPADRPPDFAAGAALPGAAPFVRYVLVRPVSIERGEARSRYMSLQPDAMRS